MGHIFYIKNKFILKIKLGKWVPVGAQIALFLQKGKMISKTFGFQHLNEKISIANYLKAVSKIFIKIKSDNIIFSFSTDISLKYTIMQLH